MQRFYLDDKLGEKLVVVSFLISYELSFMQVGGEIRGAPTLNIDLAALQKKILIKNKYDSNNKKPTKPKAPIVQWIDKRIYLESSRLLR